MTRERLDGDDKLQRLLRSLDDGPAVPADARQRLAHRLRLSTALDRVDRADTSAVRTNGPSSIRFARTGTQWAAGIGWGRAPGLLVVGGVAGLVAGLLFRKPAPSASRTGLAPPATSSAESRPPIDSSALAVVSPVTDQDPAANTADPLRAREVSASSVARASASSSPSHAGTATERSSPGSLAAERRILDAARAALVDADAARAYERLGEHAKRFPRGILAEEREALFVNALVAKGRYDEARRRASAFLARYPHSLFLSSVDAALDAIP